MKNELDDIFDPGTGQMAIALSKLGMKASIDALDGNMKMLEKAENKKLYRYVT